MVECCSYRVREAKNTQYMLDSRAPHEKNLRDRGMNKSEGVGLLVLSSDRSESSLCHT